MTPGVGLSAGPRVASGDLGETLIGTGATSRVIAPFRREELEHG